MRTRTIAVAFAGVLLFLGCEKKAKDLTPSGGLAPEEVAANPEAAAQKAAEAMQAGKGPAALITQKIGGGKLDCDVLVPAALRDKYMKGAEMRAGSMVGRTLMCSAERNGGLAWHVTYDCRPTTTLAQFKAKAAEETKDAPSLVIENLGRAAFGTETQIELYDDDADCHVTVSTYVEGEKVRELAQDLVAVLKPALLPAVEKGKYTLDCEKLVPAALRDKHFKSAKPTADSIMKDQMTCKFPLADFKTATVNYTCSRVFGPEFVTEMRAQMAKQKMKSEEVAVGKGAFYTEMLGTHNISLVDGETGCMVNVMTMVGDKAEAIELARGIEKALTVESAQ